MNSNILKITAITVGASLCGLALADRHQSVPVSQRYFSNLSENEIEEITNSGYRMHDIEVIDTSPYRYAGSMVKNTDPYEQNWWWTAHKTATDLTQFYTQRSARIIDLEVNVVNGVRRYAATMVDNRGENELDWSWFDNKTYDQVKQLAQSTGSKVVDLEIVPSGSSVRYAGVMVRGSRAGNTTLFNNLTRQQISSTLSNTNSRLIDLERSGPNRYCGVMEASTGTLWWYQFDKSWQELQFAVAQFGARVIDIERYTSGGKSYFSYVLLNNSNALETRIGNLLRTNTDGTRGFILKESGGAIKGGLMEDFRFYPASSIKTLQHLFWSFRIDKLGANPQVLVPIYSDSTNDTHPLNGNTITGTTALQASMQKMMVNSSNVDTNALQDFAGNGNGVIGRNLMNAFASAVVGLDTDDIKLNHKFGAQGANSDPANIATMRQYARLYEKASDGSILSPAGFNFFRNNMLNENSNTSFASSVRNVVTEEGMDLGKNGVTRNAFWNLVQLCWKGGNWPAQSRYVSSAGWIRLPYQTVNGVVYKEFTLGAFVDDADTINLSMSNDVLPEIIRDEVRKALATWP